MLAEVEQFRVYERVPPEAPYGSLDALLRAELGVGAREAEAEIGKRAAAAWQAARENKEPVGRHGGDRKSDQVDKNEKCQRDRPSGQGGNSRKYRVKKLRGAAPDIADRHESGELKSVAAAARAARGRRC